jgi:hypothetical protein
MDAQAPKGGVIAVGGGGDVSAVIATTEEDKGDLEIDGG